MDLRDAVTLHMLQLQAEGRSAATIRHYELYERAFLEYLQSHRIAPTTDALNLSTVRDFLLWYRGLDRGPRARGGEVAVQTAAKCLKRLARVLEENEYVESSPLNKLANPRVAKHLRQPFTTTEVNALWGACMRTRAPARDEALFLLLLDTGMRIGEATGLRLENLELERRCVTVMGKGRRERVIPIGDQTKRDGGRTVRALRRWALIRPEPRPGGEPYVFLTRDRRALDPVGGHQIIKRIGDLAGVENVYPHRLRHTFCTWYLTTYPGDEMGLRAIVGHVSKDVLSSYVHLSHATIAQRQGRASLVEQLSNPDRTRGERRILEPLRAISDLEPKSRQDVKAPVPPPAKPVLPPARARLDSAAIVDAVRSDPGLLKALLQALLGGAA